MKALVYYSNKTNPVSIRSLDWFKYKLKEEAIVIKLRDKGKLIGNCYIKENIIYGLVIKSQYRKNNYGKILLDKACKMIWKKYKTAKLIPQDNEIKLRNYYSKLGFKGYSKTDKGYEEEDKEWWWMWKDQINK